MASIDFPAMPNLGKQSKFEDCGLTLISHKEPQIRLIGNQVQIEIGFKKDKPVKVLSSLISLENDKKEDDNIFIHRKEKDSIQFEVTIPKKGFWRLIIFASPASDSGSLQEVFDYCIHCPKVIAKAYPYPKAFSQWNNNCFLYDPLILHKDVRGPSVHFKVRVPKANDVAVSVNNEQPWIHLKDELGNGIWEGNVKVGEHYGKKSPVTLNARYGDDAGSSYTTLLTYTI